MTLVDGITAWRKARGMSERALLRKAGVGASLLKDLRRNRSREIRSGTLQRIAAALGCGIDDLYAPPPALLPAEVRPSLAQGPPLAFEVDAPDTARSAPQARRGPQSYVLVPEYDVRASAGGGAAIDREDLRALWPFSRQAINELRLERRDLAIVEVVGDSMTPTLHSGDKVMVDLADRRIGVPGLFAIWDSDGLVVKRVERIWAGPDAPQRLKLISDNAAHTPYEVDLQWVQIVGRIVLLVRRF
ncbi:MAG: S24 family peptidase [Hyphomonadaceae bacterium]|nr:S24 family peptidase [Hyphomonadaceae bacterium]